MPTSDFARGDHVRVIKRDLIGQVTHVFRAPGRSEALEYDVISNTGERYTATPGELESAPMYVIVERCLGMGNRGPVVYDCHPDSSLEDVQERAAEKQANAIRCGRTEDTYRVAELRYVDEEAAGDER